MMNENECARCILDCRLKYHRLLLSSGIELYLVLSLARYSASAL